jgi:acylphosphatase
MRIARRLTISGHVQGVGFRWFTVDAARREGVTGWVRNLPDGRVEAFVEGDEDAVTRIERVLRRGPSRARVEHVTVMDEEPGGAYPSFSIS